MKKEYYSISEVCEIEGLEYHQVIRKVKKEQYEGAIKIGWGWAIPVGSVKKKGKKK